MKQTEATETTTAVSKKNLVLVPWWFTPAFLTVGQLLMRGTGYTAWAASVGREFMLGFIFYMALLGPIVAARCLVLLHKLSAANAA